MTNDVFPFPNKWSTRPVFGPLVISLIFAGIGIWWVVAAAFSGLGCDWLRAVFLLFAGGVFLAGASAFPVADRSYRRIEPSAARIELRDNSIRITPARGQQITQMTVGITFVVAGSIFAIGTWTSTLDLPISPGFSVFYPPLAFGIVLLVLTMLGRTLIRGRTYGQLILGPDAVSQETGEREPELAWDNIAGMSINAPRVGRTGSAGCVITLHPVSRRAPIAITTNMLSTGCAPTYWLLKYYVDHPEDRDELGDQRAVDRLMSGRVVTRR